MIAEVANLRQAIDAIKEKGIWVVATDESGDLLYDEVDYRGPTALVIGGEAEGIRRLVLEGCDQVVRIPMEGSVASLNAAAAGTVVLYEALRQRRRNVPPSDTQTPRPERSAVTPQEQGMDDASEAADEEAELDVEATEDLAREDGELPTSPAGDGADGVNADAEPEVEVIAEAPKKRAPRAKKPATAKKPTTRKKPSE
jgi:hypothetical protein